MKRIHRLLLSVFSGGILSLAWLGYPGWILFIGFLPLLLLDNYFVERKDEFRGVSFWGHAFLSMLTWNILTTWWVGHASVVGALMAIITNSFLMSLVWWLAHTARRKFKASLGYIALVVFWISFEFFHYNWDIEWPWINLGNGFANNVKMVQWYEFTGTLGGTLWILVMNILIFKILQHVQQKTPIQKSITPLITLVILIIIPLSVSFPMYFSYVEKENPREVVVVQPNVDPYNEDFDQVAENAKVGKIIRLAEQKADEETDLIVGPETIFESVRNWDETMLPYNSQYSQLVSMTGRYPNAETIFGATTLRFYEEGKQTNTARPFQGRLYDVFNTALFIQQDLQNQIYHKSILVNGVEKIPFMKYLGFLRNIFIDLGGASGSLGSQDEASVFTAKDGTKIAPVICYESIFGEYVTDYINKGANLIVIITNDGWWKNTPGYKQHMSYARLRAIETRRSIARSANTGISCFINQRGDVTEQTDWWVEASIKAKINSNDEITFYVKHGDYIGRIAVFVSVLLVLFLIVKRFT